MLEVKAIAEMKAQSDAKKQAAADARAKDEALKQARQREQAIAPEAIGRTRKLELEEPSRACEAADKLPMRSALLEVDGVDVAARLNECHQRVATVVASQPALPSVPMESARVTDLHAEPCAKQDSPQPALLSGIARQTEVEALSHQQEAAVSGPLLARIAELQAVVGERERQLTVYAGQAAQYVGRQCNGTREGHACSGAACCLHWADRYAAGIAIESMRSSSRMVRCTSMRCSPRSMYHR